MCLLVRRLTLSMGLKERLLGDSSPKLGQPCGQDAEGDRELMAKTRTHRQIPKRAQRPFRQLFDSITQRTGISHALIISLLIKALVIFIMVLICF